MKIQISDHFTLGRLLRYTAPTALMMVFTSIYGIVDGLFVSNFVGVDSFAALNLVYPFVMMLSALGFMMGTGGTALVAKTLGEGDKQRANGLFSLFVLVTFAVGIVCGIVVFTCVRPVAQLMGASGFLLEEGVAYGSVLAFSLPFLMLQTSFQSYLSAAGKPKVGLAVEVVAGVANIVLDAVLIVGLGWGITGAAVATAASEILGGALPLLFFFGKRADTLRLVRPLVDFRALGRACLNGSSELVSNISMSLVSMLYNYQLMAFLGSDGVAAYGVIQYLMWIFASLFMGYSVGASPLVSYNHGAKNHTELSGLLKKSLGVIAVAGVVLTALALLLGRPAAMLFVGYDQGVTDLTAHALSIYSYVFLLMGFSVFGSAFFTALNNGLVSALISFLRTLVFECGAIMILPMFFGEMGIWSSIIVAECMSVAITAVFLVALREHYHYA